MASFCFSQFCVICSENVERYINNGLKLGYGISNNHTAPESAQDSLRA